MAGAGFKTFNTGDVLTASDVNTYLMQQTVMVFDDAAARTTALTGVVAEGMMSYLKDTNKTYRYDGSAWLDDAGTTSPLTTKGDVWGYSTTDARIPIGADGTVLTADSTESLGLKWAAAAGGGLGTYTLLNAGGTALTGAATITVSGISDQQALIIYVLAGSSANASSYFDLRFNADSGTNYYWSGTQHEASSNVLIAGVGSSGLRLASMSNNAASAVYSHTLVFGTNASGKMAITHNGNATAAGGTGWYGHSTSGYYDASASITSISIISSTGNFDAGTVYVFGMS